ncbi:MAG: hypothetical protein ACRDPK_19625 [Carbonactinosporaceae bacterium]
MVSGTRIAVFILGSSTVLGLGAGALAGERGAVPDLGPPVHVTPQSSVTPTASSGSQRGPGPGDGCADDEGRDGRRDDHGGDHRGDRDGAEPVCPPSPSKAGDDGRHEDGSGHGRGRGRGRGGTQDDHGGSDD